MVSERALRDGVRDALVAGATASLCSTAALALCGRLENGNAVSPTNATSHWLWGDPALHRHRPNLRNTLLGYAIHHLASTLWAGFFEAWRRADPPLHGLDVGCRAATVAGAAYFVDFTLTPERLTPGFERHLSQTSLLLVYAAFAAGLALPHVLVETKRKF